jgi:hypothetical protein
MFLKSGTLHLYFPTYSFPITKLLISLMMFSQLIIIVEEFMEIMIIIVEEFMKINYVNVFETSNTPPIFSNILFSNHKAFNILDDGWSVYSKY